jgi:hypothetical protein
MSNSKNLPSIVLTLLAVALAALIIVLCTSCASTPEIRYQTVEVIKPVAVPPPPLTIPQLPETESLIADEADWLNYLRAMTRDLLNAWAWIELVNDRIEQYNKAAGNPVTEPIPGS